MILETLLETGEYRKSRPGKSDFVHFTCTVNTDVDNEPIDINVAADHPNKKQALTILSTELTSKRKLKKGRHFVISNNKITITKEGFQQLQKQAVLGTELEIAMRSTQLIFDLATKNMDELDKTLKAIIISPNHPLMHPMFRQFKGADNTVWCCFTDKKLALPLATQIGKALKAAIERRLPERFSKDNDGKLNSKITFEEIGEENDNYPKVISIKVPRYIYDSFDSLYANNHMGLPQPAISSPHVPNQPIPDNSYVKIAAKFSQIESANLEDETKRLQEYAALISSQPDNLKNIYKEICFKYITQLFKNMITLEKIANLFELLLTLKPQFDIHRNPKRDSFFFRHNTDSWQDMIGNIRNDAFLKLTKAFNRKAKLPDSNIAIDFLKQYRNKKLFSEHQGNGLSRIGKTATVKEIDEMLSRFEGKDSIIKRDAFVK